MAVTCSKRLGVDSSSASQDVQKESRKLPTKPNPRLKLPLLLNIVGEPAGKGFYRFR